MPDGPGLQTEEAATPQAPPAPTKAQLIEAVRAYHPDASAHLLGEAYEFAKKHHGTQLRASGEAYYSHPVAVAMLLTEVRMDQVTIMAGLLHDTVEDTGVELIEIADTFGGDVAELVDGVTKLTQLELSSAASKQAENFQKFILATVSDVRVLLVKLADRLHNMRTLHFIRREDKRVRIARETMDIYAPLARRVGLYRVAAELEDLSFAQVAPAARKALLHRLQELEEQNAPDLERIRRDLANLMDEEGITCRIKGRRKQPFSIWRKLERKSISFRDVADIFAFRVITDTAEDCYRALGAAHLHWASLPDRFRDFISVPKPNGYKSLHTTVRASGNRRVELQIRTEDMDATAENGVAAHWSYKGQSYGYDAASAKAAGLDAERNLMALADLLAHEADPDEFLEHAKLEMYREHVFVFTPKGRLVVLPAGAKPLDFAYAVHTAVGDTTIGARVNGETRPLSQVLRNGDVVEIVRGKQARPVPGWETLVETGRARSAIRRLTRTKEKAEFLSLGRGMVDQSLQSAGIDPVDVNRDVLAGRSGYDSFDAMAEDVGRGRLATTEMIEAGFPGYVYEPAITRGKTPLNREHAPLLVHGSALEEGTVLNLGRCCSPVPGDRIIGIQRPERGLVVHTIDCPRLARYDRIEDEAWVDLNWTPLAETEAVALGRIRVSATNRMGVLATLCGAVANAGGNIRGIRTDEKSPDFIDIVFEVEIEDRRRLEQILTAMRTLAVVDSAVREQDAEAGDTI